MLNYKTAREAGWISTSAKEENFVDDVVRCFSIWDKYAEFVAWAERGDFGNSALVLRHEDLVKKPVAEYQRIIEHIDEEPGEKTLSMFANAIANSSFLEDQVSGQTFSEMKVDYRSLARSNSRFQKMCEIISGCSTRHVSVLGYQSYMAESVKLLAGAE